MKPAGEFSTLCRGAQGCESLFNTINLAPRKKKNPLPWNINSSCQHQHSRILLSQSHQVEGKHIFSALGSPNTELSCPESCLSAWSLPKLLEFYFPLGLIIPSLEMNCSGASIWQWEHPDLAGIVRAEFLQRPFRELSHSLPKFVSPLSPYSVFSLK